MAAILVADVGGCRQSLAGWDSTGGLRKTAGPFSHYHGGSPNIP